MLLQIILLIILSFVAIMWGFLFAKPFQFLYSLYVKLANWLGSFFAANNIAQILPKVLALLIIPTIASFIALIILKITHRKLRPTMMIVWWIFWLILSVMITK